MKRVLAVGRSWQQVQAERAEHRRVQPRLTDARLVAPAVGLWCFTALWILVGARWALWAGALLACLALGSWCGAQLLVRKSIAKVKGSLAQAPVPVLYTLVLTCLLAALQTVALQARGYPQQWELMQALNGQGIRVTAEVTEARPAPTGGYRLQVETVEIRQASRTWAQRVPLSVYTDKLFIPGSTVSAVGELKVSGTYYRLQGAVSLLEQPASVAPDFELKSGLRDRAVDHLGAERAGLLLGMAYGDDSSLPAPALSSLRVAGLTHLTAVSGANITLIFVVAYRLLYPLWPRRPALIAVGVAASSAYVLLVGLDGSVLRAWVMGLLGALGLVFGHGAYRLVFLSTCVMALLLAAPPLATHYGFILSVVATASLLILAPAISRLLSRWLPLLLADLVALPCAASLWCAPVILILSESIYPYTVLANLLVAPLVAPITVLGLLALIGYALGLAHPLLDALMNLGGFLTQGLLAVAAWCYKLPASQLPLVLSPFTLGLTLLAVVSISWLVLAVDRSLTSLPAARLPRLLGGRP